MPSSDPLRFPLIDPRAWEHPADRAAMEALRAIPGFDALVRASLGRLQDSLALPGHLREARPAAEVDPGLGALWAEVQAVLDAPTPIPLWVRPGVPVNGYAMGARHPVVVITEGALRRPRAELRALLAHELGHVLSGHAFVKSLVRSLQVSSLWVLPGGLALLLTPPLLLALLHWDRLSELSADRAEILVTGALGPSVALLRSSRVEAGPPAGLAALLEGLGREGQALREALQRALATHPPEEERVAAMTSWFEGPVYAAIRAGDYPRRDPEAMAPADLEARVQAFARLLRRLRDG